MKGFTRRFVCLLMASMLLLATATACGSNTAQGNTTAQQADATTAAAAAQDQTQAQATEAAATAAEQAAATTAEQAAQTTEAEAAAPAKKDPTDIVIGFAAPYATHPAWAGMKQGCLDAASDAGFTALWQGPGDGDVSATVETIEAFIAQKVDGLVIMPLSPSAFEPVLKKAQDAGIPVVTFGVDADDTSQRLAWVGTDNTLVGAMQIQGLHEALGRDDMKVGVIMSNFDATNQLEQIEAFRAYLKDYESAGAEIVDIRDDKGAADDSITFDTASAMLLANPEINLMICCHGAGAATIAKAVDEMGLSGKVLVSGYDDQERNVAAVDEGSVYSLMVQNFYNWGFVPTRLVFNATQGQALNDSYDGGFITLTKENLDTYNDILIQQADAYKD